VPQIKYLYNSYELDESIKKRVNNYLGISVMLLLYRVSDYDVVNRNRVFEKFKVFVDDNDENSG